MSGQNLPGHDNHDNLVSEAVLHSEINRQWLPNQVQKTDGKILNTNWHHVKDGEKPMVGISCESSKHIVETQTALPKQDEIITDNLQRDIFPDLSDDNDCVLQYQMECMPGKTPDEQQKATRSVEVALYDCVKMIDKFWPDIACQSGQKFHEFELLYNKIKSFRLPNLGQEYK